MPPKKDAAAAAGAAGADAAASTITGFDTKETRILAAALLSQTGHDKVSCIYSVLYALDLSGKPTANVPPSTTTS